MTWRSLFLTLIIGFCASTVYADFTLSHGVGLRLEYNDNIFLDPDGEEEDDFIASASPNVSITWEIPHLTLSLNGGLTMEKYLDHTEEDNISPSLDQPAKLDLLFNLYRDVFLLSITDTFSQEVIDEGGRRGEGNNTVNLTNTNRLRVNPYLQFQPNSRTQLQLGYIYENLWYSDEDGDDAGNHLHYANVTRELSARISMSLSGSYDQYRPKDPDEVLRVGQGGRYEYDRKSASVGLSYQVTDRLRLNGQYGHTWLDYAVREDSDADIWSAAADYEITSNYTTGVQYTKSYVVSVEDGPSETDRLLAYLAYDERFSLKFSLFTSSSDYVEINRSTDSYGGELSGDLPFNDKVGVTGLLRYTNFEDSGIEVLPTMIVIDNSFVVILPGQSRFAAEQYDRYSARFSLYYATRLGRVSAGYIYNRDDSDLDDGGYTNNIVYIEASLRF